MDKFQRKPTNIRRVLVDIYRQKEKDAFGSVQLGFRIGQVVAQIKIPLSGL